MACARVEAKSDRPDMYVDTESKLVVDPVEHGIVAVPHTAWFDLVMRLVPMTSVLITRRSMPFYDILFI